MKNTILSIMLACTICMTTTSCCLFYNWLGYDATEEIHKDIMETTCALVKGYAHMKIGKLELDDVSDEILKTKADKFVDAVFAKIEKGYQKYSQKQKERLAKKLIDKRLKNGMTFTAACIALDVNGNPIVITIEDWELILKEEADEEDAMEELAKKYSQSEQQEETISEEIEEDDQEE